MLRDIEKHREAMIKILKDIYSNTDIGPLLGFKGGTAAYLFYNLDRFSVDLDFDLLKTEKENEIFKKIKGIAEKRGVIKDSYNKKFTIFTNFSYSENTRNIKIEINKRKNKAQYRTKNYLGIPMLVMVKEDMFAYKLIALTDRKEIVNRDIYDINFFFKNDWDINKDIVESETGMEFKKYLKKCINTVEKVDEKSILSGLGELIDQKDKNRIKNNLLEDTIFQIKLKLDSLKKS